MKKMKNERSVQLAGALLIVIVSMVVGYSIGREVTQKRYNDELGDVLRLYKKAVNETKIPYNVYWDEYALSKYLADKGNYTAGMLLGGGQLLYEYRKGNNTESEEEIYQYQKAIICKSRGPMESCCTWGNVEWNTTIPYIEKEEGTWGYCRTK